MTPALLDFLVFLTGTLVLLILVGRSIAHENRLEKLQQEDNNIKGRFANEWTKLIMDEVDAKLASHKHAEQSRDKHGKFIRSGDTKPAL